MPSSSVLLDEDDGGGDSEDTHDAVCEPFIANASVPGDQFAWHYDADPSSFAPSSKWAQAFGHYVNREKGKPLFVSLILYLNDAWGNDMHAETLFLDDTAQCGVFVRPKAGRIVLMDQDMWHRILQSSPAATSPRYSLVWKLVFYPTADQQYISISSLMKDKPTLFGSARKLGKLRETYKQ
mmetsp:Transcript_1816/g.4085  ORF Transcript_1816/g.4085 Transcript_1816/m.4085 type:complete len:181 (+) Transcript_1816:416-958(+)